MPGFSDQEWSGRSVKSNVPTKRESERLNLPFHVFFGEMDLGEVVGDSSRAAEESLRLEVISKSERGWDRREAGWL